MAPQPVGSQVTFKTGANKGIDLEITRQLGRQGITVLVGVCYEQREEKAAESLQSESISARFIRLNVTSQNIIDQAVRRIEDDFDRGDTFVNRASICIDDTLPSRLDLCELAKAI